MGKKRSSFNQKDPFDSVVRNAIDFFKKSISELKKEPKYSVINFCSSVELFLKARLMREHWSLIVTKAEDADYHKFVQGDFKSVSMDDAIKRLEKICGQKIQQDDYECFKQLREHRNNLVHFFHDKYIGKSDKKIIHEIVSEQCKGWFYLHGLLTVNWEKEFKPYKKDIAELDWLMRRQRQFLATKYEVLKKGIKEDKQKGVKYYTCFACGFESYRQEPIMPPLYGRKCLVCNVTGNALEVPCPECDEPIYVEDMGEGECDHCGEKIELEDLVDIFGDEEDTKDYLSDPSHAFCADCEYTSRPTVVPFNEKWLCLNCLTLHDRVGTCGWCNERSTGDLDYSYLEGCVICEGHPDSD